jgi:hypothetical protein
MILDRIVHLIDNQSHDLTSHVVQRLRDSFATPKYGNLPREELWQSVHEVHRHLENWLLTKDEPDLARRFLRIGMERARQNVPFGQVVAATVLIKVNLWEFLKKHNAEERTGTARAETEMLQVVSEFFDRVFYYLAVGYDRRSTGSRDEREAA